MKILSNFGNFQCQNNRYLENDFLQKLKKVVRIVLHGPAISQSHCRKSNPYQLPYNEMTDEAAETKNLFNKEKSPALTAQSCVNMGDRFFKKIETSSENLRFCPWDLKDSPK